MNNDKISQRGLNNNYADGNACNPVSCFSLHVFYMKDFPYGTFTIVPH